MRVLIYILVLVFIVFLFLTFIYLMKAVDPGLKPTDDQTLLPPEMYVDVGDYQLNISAKSPAEIVDGLAIRGTSRYNVNAMDPRQPLLPRDNPDYGLEKIPEGEDADEFRKRLITKTTKYDLEMVKTSYEPGKRVVPPIWPSDNNAETKVDTHKNKASNLKEIETTSAVKGHRRSVNDDKPQYLNKNPASIVLKILDDGGHKKIEIKFVSDENINTKKLRKNRSSNQLKSNTTTGEVSDDNDSTKYVNDDNVNDKIIYVKADDVILLNIVNDSEVLLQRNVLFDVNRIDDSQNLLTNSTVQNYVNKTLYNEVKLINLEESKMKREEELTQNHAYTFSLYINGENSSIDSNNLNTSVENPDFLNETLKRFNFTRAFNDILRLENQPENILRK